MIEKGNAGRYPFFVFSELDDNSNRPMNAMWFLNSQKMITTGLTHSKRCGRVSASEDMCQNI